MGKIALFLPFVLLTVNLQATPRLVRAVAGEGLDSTETYLESLAMIPKANATSEMELQSLGALQCIYQNDDHFRMGTSIQSDLLRHWQLRRLGTRRRPRSS